MSKSGSNFSKIIKSKGIRKSDVSKATGIPYSCFTDWTHGRYTPKLEKIHKIAEYLNVSPAILLDDSLDLCEFDKPIYDKQYEEVVDLYSRLNDDDKVLIVEMMKNMHERDSLLNKIYKK